MSENKETHLEFIPNTFAQLKKKKQGTECMDSSIDTTT